MPNNNNLSGLYLYLGPDNSPAYEEKCKACGNDNKCHSCIYYGNEHKFKECVQSDTMSLGRCNSYKCLFCHGTGHVLKRLVGSVKVEPVVTQKMGTDPPVIEVGYEIFGGGWDKLSVYVDELIAAYRDGTLPQAVRDGLREVDAE